MLHSFRCLFQYFCLNRHHLRISWTSLSLTFTCAAVGGLWSFAPFPASLQHQRFRSPLCKRPRRFFRTWTLDRTSRAAFSKTARAVKVHVAFPDGFPSPPARYSHDSEWRFLARRSMDVHALFQALSTKLAQDLGHWRDPSALTMSDITARVKRFPVRISKSINSNHSASIPLTTILQKASQGLLRSRTSERRKKTWNR